MNRSSNFPPPSLYPIPHQYSRRSFLAAAAAIALGNLLTGCSGQKRQTLSLRLLNGSIPPQIMGEYRKHLRQAAIAGALEIAIEPQLQSMFDLLQTWTRNGRTEVPASSWFSWVPLIGKRSNAVPDLVTIGDYWLDTAIQQGLIQPLDPKQWLGWEPLPQAWKALVTRVAATKPTERRIWGAPYRWGSTVIAYRQDIFREKGLQPPTDWSDLWRSDLRGRISLLDQPREVIGLTLKKLGQSYNIANLETVPTLQAELVALHQQVKLYSSDAYLQPLLLGDTWVAVGWSTDVVPLTQRNQTIAAVVPKSGTALWADLWVRPAVTAELPPLAADWINFCWRPDIASQLSLLSRATSPAVLEMPSANLPTELRQNPVLLPDAATQQASEFLKPLDRTTAAQYQALWHLRQEAG